MGSLRARRIYAFVIDCIALFVPGILVCYIFCDLALKMGSLSPLIGMPIAVAYLGLCRTSSGDHQTLGQRVSGIKLTADDGAPLDTRWALARAFIVSVPWCFNLSINIMLYFSWAFILPNLYLLVFNVRDGRLLQDFFVKSRVTRKDAQGVPVTPLPTIHRVACVGIVMAMAGGLEWVGYHIKRGPAEQALRSLPGVRAAKIEMATFKSSSHHDIKRCDIFVIASGDPWDDQRLAIDIANTALRLSDDARSAPYVKVIIMHWWNVGLAHVIRFFDRMDRPQNWANAATTIQPQ